MKKEEILNDFVKFAKIKNGVVENKKTIIVNSKKIQFGFKEWEVKNINKDFIKKKLNGYEIIVFFEFQNSNFFNLIFFEEELKKYLGESIKYEKTRESLKKYIAKKLKEYLKNCKDFEEVKEKLESIK